MLGIDEKRLAGLLEEGGVMLIGSGDAVRGRLAEEVVPESVAAPDFMEEGEGIAAGLLERELVAAAGDFRGDCSGIVRSGTIRAGVP